MITPRTTRLVRVPDLHDFRRVIAHLVREPAAPSSRVVVVPTRGAAQALVRTLDGLGVGAAVHPILASRDDLYDVLHARLSTPVRRLGAAEREALAQAATREAELAVADLAFRVRPGLVTELVRFYDQLRRQSQSVKRFEELIADALGGGDLDDRGAERLLRQTRFLAHAFRSYETRVLQTGAVDEHGLRERLVADADVLPLAHVIVTVPDWIADPAGLYLADFDLLNRLPNVATIDLVSTETVLASGFHERLHTWWPGIDECMAAELTGPTPFVRPRLVCPDGAGDSTPLWFTHRDREEELLSVARRLSGARPDDLDRVAIVFKLPLPYLYLAADTLGAAGLPVVSVDALPLASEPTIAAIDLVLDAIESAFVRDSLVALLRSPHLTRPPAVTPEAVAAMNHALSEARYLGDPQRLRDLAGAWRDTAPAASRPASLRITALPALQEAIALADALAPLTTPRPASSQLRTLAAFFEARFAPLADSHPLFARERRARATVLQLLAEGAAAHATHYDPDWTIAELAPAVRRWISEQTFVLPGAASGVRLLDDQAARYGLFDDITVVGLVEQEWPEKPRRNIFYPPQLLKALGWPSEKDRRGAADARFIDLLGSASTWVELSTFQLDDEAIVSRSMQLDDVARAHLSTVTRTSAATLIGDEALAQSDVSQVVRAEPAAEWLALRVARPPADDPDFHGRTGPREGRTWSVSALETYIGCPFRFFAQHILRLEEEPDDEEVMDPRRQGQFVHGVFETFFTEWQDRGHREITAANLPDARRVFVAVVDRALAALPEGEAALERTRLLGSPAAAGLGEAVFRMEAERPVPVVRRLLEEKLDGLFTIESANGPRLVSLRGKADRIDLLADGTFRLIDYKLGWPPDRNKALQLPIYALCAEQALRVRHQRWVLGEAMYLAFKGPRRVVPLFSTPQGRTDVLIRAQQRLVDTIDAIERGDFPPSPDDVYRCETCSYASVCRKDYVGDV